MKKHRVWVQYIIEGDIAGVIEVCTDNDINAVLTWNEVKRILGSKNLDLIKFREYQQIPDSEITK